MRSFQCYEDTQYTVPDTCPERSYFTDLCEELLRKIKNPEFPDSSLVRTALNEMEAREALDIDVGGCIYLESVQYGQLRLNPNPPSTGLDLQVTEKYQIYHSYQETKNTRGDKGSQLKWHTLAPHSEVWRRTWALDSHSPMPA